MSGPIIQTHAFVPMKRDARYCGYMGSASTVGSPEHGYFSMTSECGYPPGTHPADPGAGPVSPASNQA